MKYYYLVLIIAGIIIGTCSYLAPIPTQDYTKIAKTIKAEAKWRNWIRYQKEVVHKVTE